MEAYMYVLCALVVLTVRCDALFLDEDKKLDDGNEEKSLTSEVVDLLNGTYFNLNEKVCNLQRRVDAIEKAPDSESQCTCNNTEILEFMRSVSTEVENLSKALHSFENELRILKTGQASLWEILDKGSDDGCNVTMTTASPIACDDGWMTSPAGKCYYVSLTSEKTTWSTAIQRCSAMGAKLVEFKTDEEAQFVMQNLPSRAQGNNFIYTGRRRTDDDVWVFLSNDEVVDTTMRTWGEAEPDGGTQSCGCTKAADNFFMWDCLCTGFDLFYICETLASPATTTTPVTTTVTMPTPSCKSGWIASPEGKCYYIPYSYDTTDWSTAIQRCSDMGAMLAELKTDEEAQFVMNNLPQWILDNNYLYTGRERNDDGVWVYLRNKEKVDTTVRTWGDGEPDGSPQDCGCTKLGDNFLMWDCFCTGYNLYYICQTLPDTAITAAPRDCDEGWITSLEKCYYVASHSEQTDWPTAVTRCKAKGAKLVEIKTDEEGEFIRENLPYRISNDDYVYTGRRRTDEKVWVFHSNNDTIDYSLRTWEQTQPDGTTMQTCGCTSKRGLFRMYDCVCTGFNNYYICEIAR